MLPAVGDLRNRIGAMVCGVLLAAMASSCGLSINRATNSAIGPSSPAPSAAASVGPCPIAPGAAIDRPTGGVERILFARPTGLDSNDLWIYDMKTDKSRRLVRGGKNAVHGADFSGPETISYGLGDYDESRVMEMDLRTGKSRVLLEGDFTPGAWDPTGSALSLTRSQSREVGVSSVALTAVLYCRATDKVHRLRALGDAALRAMVEDEYVKAASWSPDGRMLLVQEVLYSDEGLTGVTMFVVRPDGSDVSPPGEGTFATWSPDGSRIYCRSTYRDSYKLATPELDARRVWYSFDPATGSRQTLPVRHDAMRPSVSPDGTRLAYDTSGKHPAAYVFDLAAGTERKVADDVVDAMWASNDELVLTKTRPCNVDDCWETPWAAIGPVFRIGLTTGTRKSLSLPWVQRSYFLAAR